MSFTAMTATIKFAILQLLAATRTDRHLGLCRFSEGRTFRTMLNYKYNFKKRIVTFNASSLNMIKASNNNVSRDKFTFCLTQVV